MFSPAYFPNFKISIFPFEFVSDSGHPPFPIFPFSESPPICPEVVSGSSLLIRPKDVRAFTVYPLLSAMRT